MERIIFENLPSTNTPISAGNLNQMQSNIEESAVIVSATQPTTSEKVWIQKGKNYFNKGLANMQNRGFNSSSGTMEGTNTTRITAENYIRLTKGTYTVSFVNADKIWILAYDLTRNYKGNGYIQSGWETTNSKTFTLEDECLIRVSIANEDNSDIALDEEYNIQIEQGSTVTSYEAYIEPKVYIKNGNETYEEITNIEKANNLQNYSTAEQVIGTWTDGKPLYRKVITGTSPTVTTVGEMSEKSVTIADDIEKCFIEFGYAEGPSGNITVPFVNSSGYQYRAIATSDNKLKIYCNETAYSQIPFLISVLYTKTTD